MMQYTPKQGYLFRVLWYLNRLEGFLGTVAKQNIKRPGHWGGPVFVVFLSMKNHLGSQISRALEAFSTPWQLPFGTGGKGYIYSTLFEGKSPLGVGLIGWWFQVFF